MHRAAGFPASQKSLYEIIMEQRGVELDVETNLNMLSIITTDSSQ